MNEVVLLGAGASKEAGVPTAIEMTRRMLEGANGDVDSWGDPLASRRVRLLRFVVAGLIFQQGVTGRDPLDTGVNIEAVFNAISLLDRRNELEFSPFVAAWHPVLDDLTRTRASRDPSRGWSIDDGLNRALAEMFQGSFGAKRLREIIERMISDQTGRDESVFKNALDWMTRALIDMVSIPERERVGYLSPLLYGAEGGKRLIATLNYDTSVELAAQAAGVYLGPGLEEWVQGKYPRVDSGLQLLKLHGSINWMLQDSGPRNEALSMWAATELPIPDEPHRPPYRPGVIFGGANKLTTRGPFLDMLGVFRDELACAERLTVIGYSFGDDHINGYISEWLRNRDCVMRVVNGPDFGRSAQGFYRQLMDARAINERQGLFAKMNAQNVRKRLEEPSTQIPAGQAAQLEKQAEIVERQAQALEAARRAQIEDLGLYAGDGIRQCFPTSAQ